MSNLAIRIQNLSKMYRIGSLDSHKTLRDLLANIASYPARLVKGRAGSQAANNILWALKDVSLEINSGEVVGIIGNNGAGKSTLLKILSRVTEPTKGRVEGYGRVGSLLEVGTGFHPELTGRENVYLNGAILGMKKSEINRKFDEIVAFSEVEQFLDTPVKRYSSGMYVRLAFAVAAHLEPEILIIDEVLAVGDSAFQKKCLDKMERVGQEGRTIFFVSHSMASITRLCTRAIYLDKGRILEDGPAAHVVSNYLNSVTSRSAERIWPNPATAPQGEIARLCGVRVCAVEGGVIDTVDIRKPFRVEMAYEVLKDGHMFMPSFPFNNEMGLRLFSAHDLDPTWRRQPRPKGRYVSTVWIPGNLLAEGTLFIGAGIETIDTAKLQFYETEVVAVQIVDSLAGDSARGDYTGNMLGVVRPMLKWSTEFSPA